MQPEFLIITVYVHSIFKISVKRYFLINKNVEIDIFFLIVLPILLERIQFKILLLNLCLFILEMHDDRQCHWAYQ